MYDRLRSAHVALKSSYMPVGSQVENDFAPAVSTSETGASRVRQLLMAVVAAS